MYGHIINITNCLRGIRNVWHFYYALVLMTKVVCSGLGFCVAHPLTGR
ncbi:TPA: DUF3265 domain-containing protein [Vibrio parahaemolyticus]|nr:DUF3265 domain-containing protein [Vibrio parahaemolyticus]HAS6756033.1 DUF3265 domain-containing protein [Vibrio parahaemolyticus]HCG8749415.1 DUF3265 domain-containing protein [Vibrio parahaemolyticus]